MQLSKMKLIYYSGGQFRSNMYQMVKYLNYLGHDVSISKEVTELVDWASPFPAIELEDGRRIMGVMDISQFFEETFGATNVLWAAIAYSK